MWLFFSIRSSKGNLESHSFCSPQLEQHMDVLNDLITAGFHLHNIFMLDDAGARFEVPLAAFDGQPIGIHMRTLELEYQQILLESGQPDR